MLNVTLYPDAESIETNGGLTTEVEYVSLINSNTYGPPALVAPSSSPRDLHRAEPGETVLYINTNLVPAFTIQELED